MVSGTSRRSRHGSCRPRRTRGVRGLTTRTDLGAAIGRSGRMRGSLGFARRPIWRRVLSAFAFRRTLFALVLDLGFGSGFGSGCGRGCGRQWLDCVRGVRREHRHDEPLTAVATAHGLAAIPHAGEIVVFAIWTTNLDRIHRAEPWPLGKVHGLRLFTRERVVTGLAGVDLLRANLPHLIPLAALCAGQGFGHALSHRSEC